MIDFSGIGTTPDGFITVNLGEKLGMGVGLHHSWHRCGCISFVEPGNESAHKVAIYFHQASEVDDMIELLSCIKEYINGVLNDEFPALDKKIKGCIEKFEKRECTQGKKSKFDITTLQPFDKVLVRDEDNEEWSATIFSHVSRPADRNFYVTASRDFFQCIPYNDDTKHLVSTTDPAPDFYVTWKEK